MKDRFSEQARTYSLFRPVYPQTLIEFLLNTTAAKDLAWDCGTGNGQLAVLLAPHFKKVIATDISSKQIAQATPAQNIEYRIAAAESSDLEDNFVDLITVAQAIHWFNFNAFYKEVNRTLKPGGLFAVIGYGLPCFNDDCDKWLNFFYNEVVGPFWDPERQHIDQGYKNILFPYSQIEHPAFQIETEWSLDQWVGFLKSWSATANFIKEKGFDPVAASVDEMRIAWGHKEIKKVIFPVFLKMGIKPL